MNTDDILTLNVAKKFIWVWPTQYMLVVNQEKIGQQ